MWKTCAGQGNEILSQHMVTDAVTVMAGIENGALIDWPARKQAASNMDAAVGVIRSFLQ